MTNMGVFDKNQPSDECKHNPKDLEKEFDEVTKLCEKKLNKDETWCLLDSRWYSQWKKYVTNDGFSWEVQTNFANFYPGPINNADLFEDETYKEIKDLLCEELQYELVPDECWKLLVAHYGILGNQPAIERKVIEEGDVLKELVVEIYPIPLKICHLENLKKVLVLKCSRAMTIDELDKRMRHSFSVPSNHESRIWNAFLDDDYEEMDKTETIQKYSLQKNQLVVIESRKQGGDWKIKNDTSSTSSSPSKFTNGGSSSKSGGNGVGSTAMSSYQLRNNSASQFYNKKGKAHGLCGLNNLGNTCFMNSALQCLSNVPALTNYFKNDEYNNELNKSNPLGMGGRIATTYANLVKTLWSGETTSVAPREFKFAVGQFQSRFLGYQQQDSQELLAFLIDGLHEDLNRITKKPYIEAKDADGRPDDVVAAEAWDNHMKRNDSIIVETLHGLYRSIVDCPECPRISVTFDPFCFLTLPLPVKKEKTLECTFVPLDSSEAMIKYKLTVPKSGTIKDVCKALSEYNQKPYINLTATDVYNNRFHKVFQFSDQVRSIYDKDVIYIFEGLPATTMVPVCMRYVSGPGIAHLFGQPLLVPVQSEKTTYMHLYKAILNGAARFLTDEALKKEIADLVTKTVDELLEIKNSAMDKDQMNEDDKSGVFDLFQIKVVNSFGTFEQRRLEEDETVKLADNIYYSADWSKLTFENTFTKEWNESLTLHESLQPGSVKKIPSVVNLLNCMELFTSKEQLGKENTWYCSSCKKHQQAFKKFDLWMLPPVLIIHLKRFTNNRWSRDKLDTLIDFPLKDLDLSDFVANPANKGLPDNKRCYNLIAVSNHYGGLGGGHYTAFAKNHIDQKWHYFDDSNVSVATEKQVVTKAAYMLVYQRQDVESWFNGNTEKPFPFLHPILSPRSIEQETKSSSFRFQSKINEDDLNNNNADDSMDTS